MSILKYLNESIETSKFDGRASSIIFAIAKEYPLGIDVKCLDNIIIIKYKPPIETLGKSMNILPQEQFSQDMQDYDKKAQENFAKLKQQFDMAGIVYSTFEYRGDFVGIIVLATPTSMMGK